MDTMDWSSCFICQAHKSNEETVKPSLFIKLRNNPEILYACYKVKGNIEELSELDELFDCVVLFNICDVVKLMMTNYVVGQNMVGQNITKT